MRDIIERKISKTEKLTNKITKNIRIMIITLYFVILTGVIGFIIYLLTNKDFTDEYQLEIVCTLDATELFLEVSGEINDDDVDTNYILEIRERKDGHTSSKEKHYAGDSFADAIDSTRYAKEFLIS